MLTPGRGAYQQTKVTQVYSTNNVMPRDGHVEDAVQSDISICASCQREYFAGPTFVRPSSWHMHEQYLGLICGWPTR